MKILIVTDAWHPQLNGVVRTYEYLVRELAAMGHDVRVIGPADFPMNMPMPGYAEIRLTLFPYNRLRRIIQSFAPDVLHIATEGPLGFAARKYAVEYGVSFTSCYHTHFPDYAAARAARFFNPLETPVRNAAIRFVRYFHEASSCVLVATRSLERTLRDWDFTSPIKPMTRGVEQSVFFPSESAAFADLPRPVALYVGRIAVEKNLEAFLSMDWAGSKVLVGEGPDRERLERKYKDAHFIGVKTGAALADCYRAADVFVFPSRTDTFGMVLIEALACGLPVAAYPVSGPVDILTEDFLGAVDEDLAIAARKAAASDNKAARAAWVQNHYSWHRAARQFLETD